MTLPVTVPTEMLVFQVILQILTVYISFLVAKRFRLPAFTNGLIMAAYIGLVRRGLALIIPNTFPENMLMYRYIELTFFPIAFSLFLLVGLYQVYKHPTYLQRSENN